MFAVPIQDGTTVILNHSPQGGSRHLACLVEKAGESSTAGLPQYSLIVEPWGNGMACRLTIERTGQFERESTCSSSASTSTLSRSPSLVNATPPPCQQNVPTLIQGRRKDWTHEEKPTYNPTIVDSPSQDSMDWTNHPNHPTYAFLNQLGGQNTAFSREAAVSNPDASAANLRLLEPLFWNESDLMPRLYSHRNDDPISPIEATATLLHARTPINNYNDFMDINMLTFAEQGHNTNANDSPRLVEIPRTPHRIAAMVMGVESRGFILVENLDVAGYSPEFTHDASTRESIAKNRSRGDNADFQTAMSKFQDPMTDSGTCRYLYSLKSTSLKSPRHEVTTHNIIAEWTCICSAFFLTQNGLNTHQKSCQKWQCRESFVETVDVKERQMSGPLSRWIRGHGNRMANDSQSKETESRNKTHLLPLRTMAKQSQKPNVPRSDIGGSNPGERELCYGGRVNSASVTHSRLTNHENALKLQAMQPDSEPNPKIVSLGRE
ncbi:uncharacterized protein LACBIDRAFT_321459 [Laccaria bicolor S238N-H82]|uniref:Predicted protein n=1 Tax=Laccaria bicolor (strain S238N-H82 / ATCC MYA-4686) TaxID=486041 RepID=B0CQF5_LACBS|nr:uncharacterized protein LACBIDRAFT_321459 [Laccaria bicolor S238N-H82]EDR16195.1 predicted protein [Laccaria bicolor S238N-H82]|eukprot:XP_001874403.1 predicted protein [Laccaria bicolor S238N-H82]